MLRSSAMPATVASYCPHQSLVCRGLGGEGDWWYRSEYLPTHGIHGLNMTAKDKELMNDILEVRLSESAVLAVSSNTNTQKCEASTVPFSQLHQRM